MFIPGPIPIPMDWFWFMFMPGPIPIPIGWFWFIPPYPPTPIPTPPIGMPAPTIGFGGGLIEFAPARPKPVPDPIALPMLIVDVVAAGAFVGFSSRFSLLLIASKSTPMSANGFVLAAHKRKKKMLESLRLLKNWRNFVVAEIYLTSRYVEVNKPPAQRVCPD